MGHLSHYIMNTRIRAKVKQNIPQPRFGDAIVVTTTQQTAFILVYKIYFNVNEYYTPHSISLRC